MSTVITPNWTDASGSNIVVAAQAVAAAAASVRGTIDLRAKYGAYLFCKIGRLTTTVLAAGINVYVRRVLLNDAHGTNIPALHPTGAQFQSQIAVTVCPTVATDAAAAAKTLILSSGTSMAEVDVSSISDSAGTTFSRS